MRDIPCFLLREKPHDRINTRKETMGQKEGGEQVIACTMIEYAMPRQGKRWHPSAKSVVDGEHQQCVRRSSMPDTSLPRAAPYRFRTITCLRYHYPPSRFGKARKAVEQESCPAAFQAKNG